MVSIDRGQVVEIGNHEDLLARGGAYHALYEAQTRQVDAEAPLPTPSEPQHG
jgi:ATP-binding cassette subfamily B protein